MTLTFARIHPTRRCSNCAHFDEEFICLKNCCKSDVGFVDACREHQTESESRLGIHLLSLEPVIRPRTGVRSGLD